MPPPTFCGLYGLYRASKAYSGGFLVTFLRMSSTVVGW